MEQSQYANIPQPKPYQQETKSKVPIFVKIIGLFTLLQGGFNLFSAGLMFFIGNILLIGFGGPKNNFFYWISFIFILIQGVGLIVVSSGVRHMRRWALYSFTALIMLNIVFYLFSFLMNEPGVLNHFGIIGVQMFALVYLWSIFKKFK